MYPIPCCFITSFLPDSHADISTTTLRARSMLDLQLVRFVVLRGLWQLQLADITASSIICSTLVPSDGSGCEISL